MKIKSDFFLGTENTRKKASLSDFETHFKIQYLDPFTKPRNLLKKTLNNL